VAAVEAEAAVVVVVAAAEVGIDKLNSQERTLNP
jgi:hypothetical protein